MNEAPGYRIRPLASRAEWKACVRLQEETWGEGFAERVPTAILGIAARLGGVISGAFDAGGELAGFVFGLTGLEDGAPVHWSDMLAVRAADRGRGLGVALKLHQRERLLAMGVRRVLWTFDPLEALNARLNLTRLGAVARTYVRDMYGESDSPLHRGIGTDRLLVEWVLDSPRVRDRTEGTGGGIATHAGDAVPVLAGSQRADGLFVPGEPDPGRTEPRLLASIPRSIQEIKAQDPELARAWRAATRAALEPYMEGGWEARELLPAGGSHGLPRVLLVREPEPAFGPTELDGG